MTQAFPAHQETAVHFDAVRGDDLKRILGDIDEWKLIEILNLRPTLAEIEEAAVWASGDGDILAKAGHRQTGGCAARRHPDSRGRGA